MNITKQTKNVLHMALGTILLAIIFTFTACAEKSEHTEDGHEKGEHAEVSHDDDEEHSEGGHEEDSGHEEGGHVELSDEQIKHAGIVIEQAGSGVIREQLSVYGQIKVNPKNRQVVAARFDGVITSINKDIGDRVRKGDTLLNVEGNDSFRKYAVVSAIDGRVTQRDGNVGEQTAGRALFVVEDFTNVWVDLSLFQKDLKSVKVGQSVRVKAENNTVSEGKVSYIANFSDPSTQSVLARVVLENSKQQWLAGQFVNAEIAISESMSSIVIKNEAIQFVDDNPVIFVKGEEGFEPVIIRLGRSDGVNTEVLEGLHGDESYVSRNSFVLKSEMGKEDAEHGH